MITTSIINLKGGTGKSISAANIAYILATYHNQRVLLIDGDKQGSASRYFKLYGEDRQGLAELLTSPDLPIERVIYPTGYERLDAITSNLHLYDAARSMDLAGGIEVAMILKNRLAEIEYSYDYCIIDNGPAIDRVVLNALVASDDVLIPVRIDDFSFSGLADLVGQIDNAKAIAPSLAIRGCFITHYVNDPLNEQGRLFLRESGICPVFDTVIHHNKKVCESTFARQPLPVFNPRSWAAIEYKKLVREYIDLTKSDNKEERHNGI